jgi:hypothetical protein
MDRPGTAVEGSTFTSGQGGSGSIPNAPDRDRRDADAAEHEEDAQELLE